MADTELRDQPGEWRDSYGHLHIMCVIEEITNRRLLKAVSGTDSSDVELITKQSMATIGGLSVCREHFEKILDYLDDGKPMTAVIIDALNGELV